MVSLARGREFFVGLSILLVYGRGHWSMVIISINQLNIISQRKFAKPLVPRAGVSVSCVEAVDVLPDVCLYGLEVFPHCTEKD